MSSQDANAERGARRFDDLVWTTDGIACLVARGHSFPVLLRDAVAHKVDNSPPLKLEDLIALLTRGQLLKLRPPPRVGRTQRVGLEEAAHRSALHRSPGRLGHDLALRGRQLGASFNGGTGCVTRRALRLHESQ